MSDRHESSAHGASAGADRNPLGLTEAIVPVIGVAFAIYYLSTIWDLPYEARLSGTLVSASIFLLTAILLVRSVRQVRRDGIEPGLAALLGTGSAMVQRFGVLGLTIGYVLVLPIFGFFISMAAFLFTAMAVLGVRSPLQLVAVPLIATAVAHVLFVMTLGISLPLGPVGELIASLRATAGV